MCEVHREVGVKGKISRICWLFWKSRCYWNLWTSKALCHVLSHKWSSAETASGPSFCDVHALYGPQVEFGFGGYLQGKSHSNYVFSNPLESAFFSQPGPHHAYQQHQKELGVKAELMSISDTKWACRWKNIAAVKSSISVLLSTLSGLSVPPYRRFVEASSLSHLKKATFCVCLVVFFTMFSVWSMLRTRHYKRKRQQYRRLQVSWNLQ